MAKNKYFIISIICWLLLIISIIPLISYASYTNPSADDYTYSREAKIMYDKTGKVSDAISAGIDSTIDAYSSWQGTYFGTFLMSISPNVFSINLYKTAPIFLILIFIFSMLFFVFMVIKFIFKSKSIYTFIITPIIVFLSFTFIPSMVEGIYWYNGAWYYTFSYCLSLILFSNIIAFYHHKNKKIRIVSYSLSAILITLIGGVNFTSSFFAFIILSAITTYMFYKKSSKKYFFTGLNILFLACLLFSYLAPGNTIRGDILNSQLSITESIYHSFRGTFIFNSNWLSSTLLLLFLSLLVPILKNIIIDSKYTFEKPLLFVIGAICIFSVQFTPPLYSMNSFGPYRLINVIYYSSIILVFSLFIYIYGYFVSKNSSKRSTSKILNNKTSVLKLHHYISIILLIVFAATINYSQLSLILAIDNMSNGNASQYEKENQERLLILNDPSIKNISFKEFSIKPEGLFFDDIDSDANNWKNKAMRDFYYKDEIILEN